MAILSYRQPGLVLQKGGTGATNQQIRDLQRDLRRLGYLKNGIDGDFGPQTELAVKGLQHDLLHNDGNGADSSAAAKMVDFNQARVSDVTGKVDQPLVECLSDLLDDTRISRLPSTANPKQENAKIVAQIAALSSDVVPVAFLMAVLTQESNLKHFNEPKPNDDDTFITIGLDRNVQGQPHIITSRGYGAGQFTLFHHPPTSDEVTDFMLDVGNNVQKAIAELKEKFDVFVTGSTPGTRADDRIAEVGTGPLRPCKFDRNDSRFMKDCRQCLLDAGTVDIQPNATPLFRGSGQVYASTSLYDMTKDAPFYSGVPVRARIPCDWPYAIRRYNGSGLNSYHYQVRVLQHLKKLST